MSIQSVSNTTLASVLNSAKSVEGKTETAKTETSVSKEEVKTGQKKVDTFVKSNSTEKTDTYTEPKRLSADQLKAISDQQMSSFQNMLSKMLNKQASLAGKKENTLTKNFMQNLNVSSADSMAAASAIAEDGEWGVNAVAGRIMDMAVALSGGDTSKLSILKDAVEKGFGAAEKQWGGKLPSITDRTHEEINKRFDYWEKNGSLDGYTPDKGE